MNPQAACVSSRPCRNCRRPITEQPKGRGGWARFCSEECRTEATAKTKTTIRQLRPGEAIPSGPPRRYVADHGYIRLRWKVSPRTYVETYEHRVEGSRVTRAEHVHHVDHDRTNNTTANLEPMTAADHLDHHADLHRRLDHEHIAQLYRAGMNQIEIGAAVGCNPATVSRILKSHGVPTRPPAKKYPWPSAVVVRRAVNASTSSIEVSERLGIPVASARAAMQHHGIPPFPIGRPRAA